ncbi:hypothetical protein ACLKA6_002211 [Drosophila palustris]
MPIEAAYTADGIVLWTAIIVHSNKRSFGHVMGLPKTNKAESNLRKVTDGATEIDVVWMQLVKAKGLLDQHLVLAKTDAETRRKGLREVVN